MVFNQRWFCASPRGRLVTSGDILSCYNWVVLLASSRYTLGILLKTLQYTGQSPYTKNYPTQKVNSWENLVYRNLKFNFLLLLLKEKWHKLVALNICKVLKDRPHPKFSQSEARNSMLQGPICHPIQSFTTSSSALLTQSLDQRPS